MYKFSQIYQGVLSTKAVSYGINLCYARGNLIYTHEWFKHDDRLYTVEYFRVYDIFCVYANIVHESSTCWYCFMPVHK